MFWLSYNSLVYAGLNWCQHRRNVEHIIKMTEGTFQKCANRMQEKLVDKNYVRGDVLVFLHHLLLYDMSLLDCIYLRMRCRRLLLQCKHNSNFEFYGP